MVAAREAAAEPVVLEDAVVAAVVGAAAPVAVGADPVADEVVQAADAKAVRVARATEKVETAVVVMVAATAGPSSSRT